MPIQISAPDGSIAQFPDGMSDADISAVMSKEYGGPNFNAANGGPNQSIVAPQQPQIIPQAAQGQQQPANFAVDIGSQIPLLDKAQAVVDATLNPSNFGGAPWGTRYRDDLQNIHNAVGTYEAANPNAAYAAKAASVVGPMFVGAGEATPLVNALRGAGIGGAYGLSGTNDKSLPDDLLAAGTGAGAGLVTAGVGHAVGSLAGGVGGRVADAFTGIPQTKPDRLAAAMLLDKMKVQGITPPDLISTLASSTKPVTAMDIGGENAPLQRLGRAMVTLPGQQSQDITDFLKTRQEGQRGRVLGDISDLAPNTDTYGTAADLKDERFQGSNPLYQKAFNNPIVPDPHLDYLQTSPDIQRGMTQGIKIQQRKAFANNVPFDPSQYGVTGFNAAGDPIVGPNPSWRTWHAAREGIDDMIYGQADPLTGALPKTKDISSLQQLRSGLNNTLTTLNPDLAAADAAWSTPSQNLDAINLGQKFTQADPEEIDTAMGRMNPEAQQHYQIGAGRTMRDVANDTRDNNNIPLRLTGDQTARNQLVSAFGQGPADDFTGRMSLENQLGQTRQFVAGNSSTANKAGDVADASGPGLGGQIVSDIVKGFVTGGPHGALTLPLVNAANRMGAKTIGSFLNNEPRNLALARALTATGPQGASDLSSLLGPAQQRAATIAKGRAIGSRTGGALSLALLPPLMSPTANAGP